MSGRKALRDFIVHQFDLSTTSAVRPCARERGQTDNSAVSISHGPLNFGTEQHRDWAYAESHPSDV